MTKTAVDKPTTVLSRSVSQAVLLVTLPSTSARVAAMLCNWTARYSIVKGMIGLLEDMVVVVTVDGGWWRPIGGARRVTLSTKMLTTYINNVKNEILSFRSIALSSSICFPSFYKNMFLVWRCNPIMQDSFPT
jgi:hypothetical protein